VAWVGRVEGGVEGEEGGYGLLVLMLALLLLKCLVGMRWDEIFVGMELADTG
jgi:hypothetical protein